jgi:hypothetical protein
MEKKSHKLGEKNRSSMEGAGRTNAKEICELKENKSSLLCSSKQNCFLFDNMFTEILHCINVGDCVNSLSLSLSPATSSCSGIL